MMYFCITLVFSIKTPSQFVIGFWIVAENKLCDQQKLMILKRVFIMTIFTNEHNIEA